jgi:hypothetical protein
MIERDVKGSFLFNDGSFRSTTTTSLQILTQQKLSFFLSFTTVFNQTLRKSG